MTLPLTDIKYFKSKVTLWRYLFISYIIINHLSTESFWLESPRNCSLWLLTSSTIYGSHVLVSWLRILTRTPWIWNWSGWSQTYRWSPCPCITSTCWMCADTMITIDIFWCQLLVGMVARDEFGPSGWNIWRNTIQFLTSFFRKFPNLESPWVAYFTLIKTQVQKCLLNLPSLAIKRRSHRPFWSILRRKMSILSLDRSLKTWSRLQQICMIQLVL